MTRVSNVLIDVLKKELERIDSAKTSKRFENVIEGFTTLEGYAPRAVIKGNPYAIFNSNDYLGLRFHGRLRKAEEEASKKFGTGPGAVRFISGTLKVHRDLEDYLARFHSRDDAITFSSAFAVNMAVIHCFIKGQSKDSLVTGDTLVISDELNHRSIIDGIRVAGLPKEQRAVFRHLDTIDLQRILENNKGRFKRVLIITDGVFSMIGEIQDIGRMQNVAQRYQDFYQEGIITIVDDAHGIGVLGTGRGAEEVTEGRCDLLVGTMGKALGVDGGYVAGDHLFIDYLRESAATYIYSNPISPGTAGASLESLKLIDSSEGRLLLTRLRKNIEYFKEKVSNVGLRFVTDSSHPIQPILIGDPRKTRDLVTMLFEDGILVTNISYPVVPHGKDEIRVQLSASHTKNDIDDFITKIEKSAATLGLL